MQQQQNNKKQQPFMFCGLGVRGWAQVFKHRSHKSIGETSLGDKASGSKTSLAGNGSQKQPKTEIKKGGKLERQGGRSWRFRKSMTLSLRSKNATFMYDKCFIRNPFMWMATEARGLKQPIYLDASMSTSKNESAPHLGIAIPFYQHTA